MQIKFSVRLHWREPIRKDEHGFHVFMADMSDYGYTPVGEPITLECPAPDKFDPVNAQLKVLDEQEQKVRAEFARRITELQRQRAELLCIENNPTTVEA